jgi:hypothetical protein
MVALQIFGGIEIPRIWFGLSMSREGREKPCQIGGKANRQFPSDDNGMLLPSRNEERFSREII